MAFNESDQMKHFFEEKPALLIIDMVKDNLDPDHPLPITPYAYRITAPINRLIKVFRKQEWPVVFSTDAYHEEDFIFTGRLKPHSLAGTRGAEIAAELDYQPGKDTWLPKRRFSAFFQTGLENFLHEKKVTLCALAGITTGYCVLASMMDAICHDFKVVLLEDCTAAYPESTHENILAVYRKNPLYPLLRVESSSEINQVL